MSSIASSTVCVAPTIAELIKGVMANMPDTLDTKKEIDEYFKNAMKEIMKAKKEAEPKAEPKKRKTKKDKEADETDADEAADADVKKPKKRKTKKDKEADETADADEKQQKPPKPPKPPKRPLTKYQEFFKENYPTIDKEIPNKEKCAKIAELWKIHKADLAEKAMDE